MHTRGKGRNSLEKQRIPLGAAKCVFPEGGKSRECVEHTLCSCIGDCVAFKAERMFWKKRVLPLAFMSFYDIIIV